MTEICDRVLKAGGPAVLFERPKGHTVPVLGNLFGTARRVALGMGADSAEALREVGKLLAFLKEPEPPQGFRDVIERWIPIGREVLDMAPKSAVERAVPGDRVGGRRRRPRPAADPDLLAGGRRTADHLGPRRHARAAEEAAEPRHLPAAGDRPRPGHHALARAPRRRLDFRDHAEANPGAPFPVAVALGADPATILGAVTPVPDTLSEYQFAGLLRGARTEVVKCIGSTSRCRRRRRSSSRVPRSGRANGARGTVRRSHRLLQRAGAVPGVRDRAHHDAPRPDLPLDLHRQAAGRAGGARAWR